MDEDLDWIPAAEVKRPTPRERKQIIDTEVSRIVGKPVLANDPRLIRLVVKHRQKSGSTPDSEKPDNYLYRPEFLKELHETFK